MKRGRDGKSLDACFYIFNLHSPGLSIGRNEQPEKIKKGGRKMLSEQPARILTSRECAKILGGLLGVLTTMSEFEDLKTALIWWIDNFHSLEIIKNIHEKRDA